MENGAGGVSGDLAWGRAGLMLESLVSLLRRPQAIPDKCPSCDCRMPLEAVGVHRFFCAGCGRDHEAIQDAAGDWQVDTRPLRSRRRR